MASSLIVTRTGISGFRVKLKYQTQRTGKHPITCTTNTPPSGKHPNQNNSSQRTASTPRPSQADHAKRAESSGRGCVSRHQTMGIMLGKPAGTKLSTRSTETETETGILRPGRRAAFHIAGVFNHKLPRVRWNSFSCVASGRR